MNMGFAVISRSALGFKEKFGESKELEFLLEALHTDEIAESMVDSFFASTYDFLPVTKYLNGISFFSVIFRIMKMVRRLNVSLLIFITICICITYSDSNQRDRHMYICFISFDCNKEIMTRMRFRSSLMNENKKPKIRRALAQKISLIF